MNKNVDKKEKMFLRVVALLASILGAVSSFVMLCMYLDDIADLINKTKSTKKHNTTNKNNK